MREVTLIYAYYENPGMLQHQYEHLQRLSVSLRDHFRLIVVDDGSPLHPAIPPLKKVDFPLEIYRMQVDVRWNQDACRNLGVEKARTPWVLLSDIDHLIPSATLSEVLSNSTLREDTAYAFTRASLESPIDKQPWRLTPYKVHPNTWFMSKQLYDRVGGYDERFAGYYGTDGDFRSRLSLLADVVHLPQSIIRVPREIVPDASTTSYRRKTSEDGPNIKRIKTERAKSHDWRPARLTFPWEKVL